MTDSRCEHQRSGLHEVKQRRIFPAHRLDLKVDAELQDVDHERGGELHLTAVVEEDERGPQPELEDLSRERFHLMS